jgi:GT2 family glycosyltransferase
MEAPLVSVVIATWNRKDDILETIQSIYEQEYRPVEIVVVDNGSTDDTVPVVRAVYPEVILIALTENKGASEGRNIGIRAATGEYIFLLDSDASMGSDTISSVVQKFHEHPEIGALACKVVNFYARELDRTAGWVFSERVKSRQDDEFLSFRVSECGSAFRREVFAKAGVFWEYLFFGREGEELCLRIWDAGFQILYFPTSKVYHRVSPTKRFGGGFRQNVEIRNAIVIYIVRYTWWMILLFLPPKVISSLIKGVGQRCLPDVLKAFWDVIVDLPYLLRERRPISAATARTYVALQRDHGALSWDVISWLKYKANLPVGVFSRSSPRRSRG